MKPEARIAIFYEDKAMYRLKKSRLFPPPTPATIGKSENSDKLDKTFRKTAKKQKFGHANLRFEFVGFALSYKFANYLTGSEAED